MRVAALIAVSASITPDARDPAAAAVNGWTQSAGHRDNILGESFTEIGVGVCQHGSTSCFAQVFLHPS
jgi:uncharacterized protein YkwD